MKPLACCLTVLLAACARPAAPIEAPAASIRCELVGIDPSGDDETATATFRFTNDTGSALAYEGYSEDMPLYQSEVESAPGVWEANLVGWCGTGLATYTLAPGATLRFSVPVPRDGKRYRFLLGDLSVATPPVSAAPR